jgi:hypothetical protein
MRARTLAQIGISAIVTLFVFAAVTIAQPPPPPGPGPIAGQRSVADISVFYEELAPYGEWIDLPPFGWVWSPYDMPYDWRPYEDGHWVWTEYGWTWVSDEPFGWAVYHYGRWHYDPQYSWVWVPATTWGPAWVARRESDGWIGWGPLPPDDSIHLGVQIGGVNFHLDSIRRFHWNFIESRRFCEPRLRPYIARSVRNVNIYDHTRNVTNYNVVNNTIVNNSINVTNIEKRVGRPVPKYTIRDASRPQLGAVNQQNNVVQLYRPKLADTAPKKTPDVLFKPNPKTPTKGPAIDMTKRMTEERSLLQKRLDAEHAALLDRQKREAAGAPKSGISPDQLKKQQELERSAFESRRNANKICWSDINSGIRRARTVKRRAAIGNTNSTIRTSNGEPIVADQPEGAYRPSRQRLSISENEIACRYVLSIKLALS